MVFGWVCWESFPPPATSEPKSFIQLSLKEIFAGGRGDAYTFSYMISPVSIIVAFGYHKLECVVKDDGVRSCLIELKSFLLSKFDVDLIHSVLMYFPRFLVVPDAVPPGQCYLDLCVLCSYQRCMMQNELSFPYSLLHRSLLSCFWFSSAAMPGFSPVFPFLCPLLPLHLEF